jgi:hypothetical protein
MAASASLAEARCAEAGDPAAGCARTSKARSLLEWRSFYADVVPVDPIIN